LNESIPRANQSIGRIAGETAEGAACRPLAQPEDSDLAQLEADSGLGLQLPSSMPTNVTRAAVLVTGASRGLGRGIAQELSRSGCDVAINYRSNHAAAEECVSLCREVAPSNQQCFVAVQADIADPGARASLLAKVERGLGRIDALINNAGIAPLERADILDAEEAGFEALLRTNLQGPYFLTQAVARRWLEDPWKPALPQGFTIVFVTSISAHTASPSRGDYCVSKAGLAMAAQLWAARLAEAGICVYEVRPGIMRTDMTAAVADEYDTLIADGVVPQRRWGTPEDVGLACTALIAGELPFSTGAVLDVDGGFHVRRL
jgi:3-oxoacyl-[acyl-carrier protein] reductase